MSSNSITVAATITLIGVAGTLITATAPTAPRTDTEQQQPPILPTPTEETRPAT